MNRKFLIIFLVAFVLLAALIGVIIFRDSVGTSEFIEQNKELTTKKGNMRLESTVFQSNQNIPSKYTCDGDDINPPLAISDVPEGAKSLVLIVDDPDAPAGDWVHWTLWNIDPNTSEIAENTVPSGAVEGTTDFGKTGWGGPCPPSGTHHYQFKLYALDTQLSLGSSSKKADIEKGMEGHILDQTLLVGLYQRQ